MRSVIDEIAAAELKAEEIRLSAALDAREAVNRARESALSAQARLEETQRDKSLSQLEQARIEGERLSAQQLEKMEHEAQELCSKAEGKLGEAVRYLVDKVLKPA